MQTFKTFVIIAFITAIKCENWEFHFLHLFGTLDHIG